MILLLRRSTRSEKREIYDKGISAYAVLKCCPVYPGVHGKRYIPDNEGNGGFVH